MMMVDHAARGVNVINGFDAEWQPCAGIRRPRQN